MKKIDVNSAVIGGTVVATTVAIFKLGQYFVAKNKSKKETKTVNKNVVESHKDINPAADVKSETTETTTVTESSTQTA